MVTNLSTNYDKDCRCSTCIHQKVCAYKDERKTLEENLPTSSTIILSSYIKCNQYFYDGNDLLTRIDTSGIK